MNLRIATPLLLALALGSAAQAQPVLFSDDFESDTTANWTVLEITDNGVPDYTAQFNFDYSKQDYTFNGVTGKIPPAPNSEANGTHGVKVTVNKNDDIAARSAVSLFAKNQNFTGNYALRADMWVNYNGGSYGGTGSTEFGMMGINHTGAIPCGVLNDTLGTENISGDGLWFRASGEAGAGRDFRRYEGNLGFSDGLIGVDDAERVFQDRFPAPDYETPGAVGKRWVQVEVAQRDTHVVWKIDGYVIAEFDNVTALTSGTIMLGTMDPYASIADPKTDNFVLFDNVRAVRLAEPAPATVSVQATDIEASEPGTNTGMFTIMRIDGDQTQPLPVTFRLSGSATPGVDYETNAFASLTATIPANAGSVDVVIKAINDSKGEQTETVILTLTGNTNYEMRDSISDQVDLLDDNDVTTVQIETVRSQAFEAAPDVPGELSVFRLGDLSTDLAVKLKITGTALNGTDYDTLLNTATIPAGQTNVVLTVTPIDDTILETDETVMVSVETGAGYALGAVTMATVTIGDNEQAVGPTIFADDFDTDTSANWTLLFGANNNISDYVAKFAYDYSADNIPSAPHSANGTTKGVKLTVNKNDATASAAGVNIYAKGQNFSGDFALRFDMYLTFSTAVGGTTESAIFGIDHSGTYTNRHAIAGGDGLWFAVETDGSAQGGRSYVSYVGNKTTAPNSTNLIARPASEFTPYFPSPPFLAAGAASGQWVDVEVAQIGSLITWKINGLRILSRTNTTEFQSGTIMLGEMDSFNSVGSVNNFVVFDNVRVANLTTSSTITGIKVVGANLQIQFTSPVGAAADFQIVGANTVSGPYQTEAASTIQKTGEGQFTATLPLPAGPQRFYRVKR